MRSAARVLGMILLCSALGFGATGITALLVADTPKPAEKPVTKPAKPAKPKKEEEEDPAPVREQKKVPIVEGDDAAITTPPRGKAKPKNGLPLPAELLREADQTDQADLKELFRGLARPHDLIYLGDRTPRVEPIPQRLIAPLTEKGALTLQIIGSGDTAHVIMTVPANEVGRVEQYEQFALLRVEQMLKAKPLADSATADPSELERTLVRLRAAETVLGAVLRFHDEARKSGARTGAGWEEVRKPVFDRRRALQIQRLQLLNKIENWDDAETLGDQLLEEDHDNVPIQSAVATVRGRHIEAAIKAGNYPAARKVVEDLERDFPKNPQVQRFGDILSRRARELMSQALRVEATDKPLALDLLGSAQDLWPRLEGLREKRRELTLSYPVVNVGVKQLPELLSPTLAESDTEQQALALIYERLLVPTFTTAGIERYVSYRPQLARRPATRDGLGRRFELRHDAMWADGRQVTAADVRASVQLYKSPTWAGRPAEWDEFFDGVEVGGDPFRATLKLRQGYVEPLSFFTFPIVPAERMRGGDDVDFGHKPQGSGPFQFTRRIAGTADPDAGSEKVVFRVNPNYKVDGRSPWVQEVRLVQSSNPVADFKADKLQLLLDPTAAQRAELPAGTVKRVPNRRVYFLAVNHRREPLQHVELRRAIADAINRNKLLGECFRTPGEDQAIHKPLNGPYPAGSWAWDEGLPADPYQPELARTLMNQALKSFGKDVTLTLKYPAGDPEVARACQYLCREVSSVANGFTLKPEPRTAVEFRTEVRTTHDYDLAYCHWDYASEALWLWPLFDPSPRARESGGTNYLGYHNDAVLESRFQRLLGHCQVETLRREARELHRHLSELMPIIPLWQLDSFVAVQPTLRRRGGDPLDLAEHEQTLVFVGADEWQLVPK